MWSFLLGAFSALVLSVLTELATGGVSRAFRWVRLLWHSRKSIHFDVRADGLYMLGEWSLARRLEPQNLLTDVIPESARPGQQWLDPQQFTDAAERTGQSGEIVYLARFRVDHQESPETQFCRMTLAESQYAEVRGIEALRQTRPELFAACDEAVAKDTTAYLRSAVPSSIAINLIPITADHEMLCVERSSAVDNAIGLWTVGVFETMKRSDPNRPGAREDLFTLALRGLSEELGLSPHEYGEVVISWVGVYRPILRGHVVALVQLKISRDEVIARARTAHSSYEHATIDWLPLRRSLVRSFVAAPLQSQTDVVASTIHVNQRQWIEQSRLAVLEAWRFRMIIGE